MPVRLKEGGRLRQKHQGGCFLRVASGLVEETNSGSPADEALGQVWVCGAVWAGELNASCKVLKNNNNLSNGTEIPEDLSL